MAYIVLEDNIPSQFLEKDLKQIIGQNLTRIIRRQWDSDVEEPIRHGGILGN